MSTRPVKRYHGFFQAATLRFTFDDYSFALVKSDGSSLGENVIVGGENRWAYKSFVNFDFFPSESVPILVYFKETQTPESQWNVGPGELANNANAVAAGAVPGQVHFFPAISDTRALKAAFKDHGCAKINSVTETTHVRKATGSEGSKGFLSPGGFMNNGYSWI